MAPTLAFRATRLLPVGARGGNPGRDGRRKNDDKNSRARNATSPGVARRGTTRVRDRSPGTPGGLVRLRIRKRRRSAVPGNPRRRRGYVAARAFGRGRERRERQRRIRFARGRSVRRGGARDGGEGEPRAEGRGLSGGFGETGRGGEFGRRRLVVRTEGASILMGTRTEIENHGGRDEKGARCPSDGRDQGPCERDASSPEGDRRRARWSHPSFDLIPEEFQIHIFYDSH